MDILLLELMVRDLNERLRGARVAKIHQPTAELLTLRLWNGRENLKLLISVGSSSRLHLTKTSYPNPFHPPRFSQLLRARLSRLMAIERLPGERLVCLRWSGPKGECRLYAELFGTRGNLVLADDQDLIIDVLQRQPREREGRDLVPGSPYLRPKQLQRHSLLDPMPAIPKEFSQGADLRKWLQNTIAPMSSAQAKAIVWHAGQLNSAEQALEQFRRQWIQGGCQPQLVEIDGEELLVACPPAGLARANQENGLSALLDSFYAPSQTRAGQTGLRRDLQRILGLERKRLQKRIENIDREGESKESFAKRRQLGELLLAHLHQVKKGMASITVVDFAQQPAVEVDIPLDPRLTPQENAQALFKRYKKEKRGLDHIERRRSETGAEQAWLEQLQLTLDDAETPEDLFEIAEELRRAGLYQERKSKPASRKKVPATPRLNQTTSPNGFAVYWGRNNRANDYLSTRFASPHDFWFHVHNLPGCHLVLRRDSGKVEVPEDDLLFAARLAAGYSRARHESAVEVLLCQVKDLYKVKGAHPGQVNLRQFTTCRVEPLRIENRASTD